MTIRLLVFEDDAIARYCLARQFRDVGYEVQTFVTPAEIAPRVRLEPSEASTDVILTDFDMPGMDGHEWVSHLLTLGFPRQQMALMSGYWTPERQASTNHLAIPRFVKPLEMAQFQAWLMGTSHEHQRMVLNWYE